MVTLELYVLSKYLWFQEASNLFFDKYGCKMHFKMSLTCPTQSQVIGHNGHAKVCSFTGTLWTYDKTQNMNICKSTLYTNFK